MNKGVARAARVMPGPDIGRALIILFLVKPIADLFWAYRVPLAGIKVSPGHAIGFIALIYFGLILFRFSRERPYGARLFKAFIIINLVSVVMGMFYNDHLKFSSIMEILVRLLDSYVIFVVAYIAVVRKWITNPVSVFVAIAIGASLVVLINVFAIKTGFGGIKTGTASTYGSLRERGLYYDPGVLSNVAISGFLFCIYIMHMVKRRKTLVWGLCAGVILSCLYLIGLSLSRAAMMQIGIFFVLYMFVYQRSWGRLLAPVVLVLAGIAASSFLTLDYDNLFLRFQQDLEVLQSSQDEVVSLDSGEVSFGKYEQLGNNRIANWAFALTRISERSWPEIILGNFRSTVAHSDYVDVLGRNGIIGLSIYLLILWRVSTRGGRLVLQSKDKWLRLLHFVAFSQLVLYIFYAIPFRPLLYTTSVWYMWFSIGVSMGYMQLAMQESSKPKSGSGQAARPAMRPQGLSARFQKTAE